MSVPSVPWVRERDVDLLLAQLLSTDVTWTEWLVGCVPTGLGDAATERPVGAPSAVRAVVNYGRPDADAAGQGETDVLVVAEYPEGVLVVSIEDKVWAAPQDRQAERHRAFVSGLSSRWGVSVLVAPQGWIDGHPSEADEYDASVSLEDIAARCDSVGATFHAEVFRQACLPLGREIAVDLLEWHERANRLLEAELGLRLEPQRYVRTTNVGGAKPNRWPSCETVACRELPGSGRPTLLLKPSSAKHECRASLLVERPTAPLAELLRMSALSAGFLVRSTPAGSLLVDAEVPDSTSWSMAMPFDEQVEHLLAVGRAAIELRTWWNAAVVDSIGSDR